MALARLRPQPSRTASETVAKTLGDRTNGSPRSRIAATILAAINKAPFSRCLSITEQSIGDEQLPVMIDMINDVSQHLRLGSLKACRR